MKKILALAIAASMFATPAIAKDPTETPRPVKTILIDTSDTSCRGGRVLPAPR